MNITSREQEFWLQAEEGAHSGQTQRIVLRKLPRRRRDIRPSFILQRLGATVISVLGSVSLVFFLIFATGSPATLLAGGQATKEEIAALNASYGFDRPVIEQYGQFCLTVCVATLGLIAGYLSATSSNRVLREGPLALLTVVQSTPVFVTGILAVLFFSLTLGWLPTGGSGSLRHLVLPALTLSLLIAPPVARLFRTSLKQQQSADHVRTALSKQISFGRVRFRHIAIKCPGSRDRTLGHANGDTFGRRCSDRNSLWLAGCWYSSGLSNRLIDQIIARIAEIQLTIPGLVLALLALALFGSRLENLILILALESWPLHFRVSRSYTLNARNQGYMEAAWLAGVPLWKSVLRHIVPGLLPLLIATSTISAAFIIMTEAGLSFIGLGIQPPTADWGLMIAQGKSQLGAAGGCRLCLLLLSSAFFLVCNFWVMPFQAGFPRVKQESQHDIYQHASVR
ncbi:binding-protein-dependent transport system inner membrane component domain-containing protein [Ditylenchus destructor]|nr:binding-protein-dependent transport system inner membrane component domain-containing protein [Ditylenchus destructor]